MYRLKTHLQYIFIHLFIALFTVGVSPTTLFASTTPASTQQEAGVTPRKAKKQKKKRKTKRKKTKKIHKRNATQNKTILILSGLVSAITLFLLLFGFFAEIPIMLFIGLGITFALTIASAIAFRADLANFLGITFVTITLLSCVLLLLGFLFNINLMAIIALGILSLILLFSIIRNIFFAQ